MNISTLRLVSTLKHIVDTSLSNVDLDKSCEPGEPMTGNHKVDYWEHKSVKKQIFHWAILEGRWQTDQKIRQIGQNRLCC